MNREEILKMEEGHELNSLVAEHIFGWEAFLGAHTNTTRVRYGKGYADHMEFEPSANIAHAWKVIRKMIKDGFCPALLYDDNGHWTLSFSGTMYLSHGKNPRNMAITSFVEAELWFDCPEIAICKASLIAVIESSHKEFA